VHEHTTFDFPTACFGNVWFKKWQEAGGKETKDQSKTFVILLKYFPFLHSSFHLLLAFCFDYPRPLYSFPSPPSRPTPFHHHPTHPKSTASS